MDIVYICREGDNEELRYSIRSIEQNFPGQKIWVVGYKPEWYNGPFMSIPDTSTKFNNIRLALLEVCNTPEISDDFVFMNDDFFLVKPIDKFITYSGGLLADKINRYRQINPTGTYLISLKQTFRYLRSLKIKSPIDYDIHVPMVFNKKKLLPIAYMQFQTRSLYGNLLQIASETITDVKRYDSGSSMSTLSYTKNEYPFLSSEDKSFEKLKNDLLEEMFPTPSRYETI
jgi:hypothetical protein